MAYFISLVKPEEARELSELRCKAWRTTYRGIFSDELLNKFDFDFHDERNRMWIHSEKFEVYFIMENSQKIGYLILQKKEPLYVQSLYLLEEFRGKGIGRKVIEFVRDYCRGNGYSGFYLGCHPQNVRALGFYEKMGGVITARDEGHENNHENSVRLEFVV